jgi:CRISPR-associated exonuclease Cas4
MFTEDELLPISALQHLAFCERQWGLIHLEQVWEENRLTAEGRILHERANEPETEVRGGLRIARGLRLRSLRLGLAGKADVVEFHRATQGEEGVALKGVEGLWMPLIVEYKRGHPKIGHEDKVQLCAQAICLEEMLGVSLTSASFFYGEPRRRFEVALDESLRRETEVLAARLHHLTSVGRTPPAQHNKRCRNCSLVHICLPLAIGGQGKVRRYIAQALAEVEK